MTSSSTAASLASRAASRSSTSATTFPHFVSSVRSSVVARGCADRPSIGLRRRLRTYAGGVTRTSAHDRSALSLPDGSQPCLRLSPANLGACARVTADVHGSARVATRHGVRETVIAGQPDTRGVSGLDGDGAPVRSVNDGDPRGARRAPRCRGRAAADQRRHVGSDRRRGSRSRRRPQVEASRHRVRRR